MIPVYIRYLSREIYAAVALVLLAFLGLFAFFDLVNELDDIGKGGYQLHHAAIYVAMILPGRVYELMPIAVLIGTLYALTTLARHSEITVLRASGLSTRRLLLALLSLTMAGFRYIRKSSYWLLVPYFLWVLFAGYLNLGIYLLNM